MALQLHLTTAKIKVKELTKETKYTLNKTPTVKKHLTISHKKGTKTWKREEKRWIRGLSLVNKPGSLRPSLTFEKAEKISIDYVMVCWRESSASHKWRKRGVQSEGTRQRLLLRWFTISGFEVMRKDLFLKRRQWWAVFYTRWSCPKGGWLDYPVHY